MRDTGNDKNKTHYPTHPLRNPNRCINNKHILHPPTTTPTNSQPKNTTFPQCTYQHTGKYDYTAKLKPNKICNQTTLKPGEGTLYTRIVDHINVTFSYTIKCNSSPDTSIEYQIKTELESPQRWVKKLTTSPSNTLNFTGRAQ